VWNRLPLRYFDFIRAYFDLFSLAPFGNLVDFDDFWIRENERSLKSLFTTTTANLKVFIDAEWTGFLLFYSLFIPFILF
jgi:hypothetical protein